MRIQWTASCEEKISENIIKFSLPSASSLLICLDVCKKNQRKTNWAPTMITAGMKSQ